MADAPRFTPFLLFVGDRCGRAEEAIEFYTSIFANSRINHVDRYVAGEGPDAAGTVKHASFSLNGQEFMAIDSAADHQFTFTPAVSMFVRCESESEVEELFGRLADGGEVLMPLGAYPFSEKYGWLNDRFGVSWQLNLERASAQRKRSERSPARFP